MIKEQLEKIISDKFKIKKEHERRKILFWYDPNGEYKEEIDALEIEGVKIWKLSRGNSLKTKYLLEVEDLQSNYLIYADFERPPINENWLIDIELYSDEFIFDKATLIMNELNIDYNVTTFKIKELIEYHYDFFRNKERRLKFLSYGIENYNEENFRLAILCTLAKTKSLDFEAALRNIFKEGLDETENDIFNQIKKYKLENYFWEKASFYFGYNDEKPILKKLLYTIVFTATQKYMKKSLKEYDEKISKYISSKIAGCYVFVDHWLTNIYDAEYYERLVEQIEKEFKLKDLFINIDVEIIKDVDTFKVIDNIIVSNIVSNITSFVEKYEEYLSIINIRKNKYWKKYYEYIYLCLEAAVNFLILKKSISGFTKMPLREIIQLYSERYYKFDYYYRKFIYYYDRSLEVDILKDLFEYIENIYSNWYLSSLANLWSDILKSNKETLFKDIDIKYQHKFYERYVDYYIKIQKEKVAVIISDALRYDVAVELVEMINSKLKGNAEIEVNLGCIPSVTRLGMSALLPHNEINFVDADKILVDGNPVISINDRDSILKSKRKDSVAISFNDIINFSRDEGRELAKNNRIIYIYHNTIDAIGDKQATENKVFDACQDAIEELINLINKLINFNVTNIIITSDHGFLYRKRQLSESSKISGLDDSKTFKRFALSSEEKNTLGVMSIDLDYINSDLKCLIPESINIFKSQGGGCNYVHGGASLQEIVIPVVKYKNIKAAAEKIFNKVNLTLISNQRKITNSITTLQFFQTEKVEGKTIEREFEIYFYDEENDEIISNINRIIANSSSDLAEERIYRVKLSLKNKTYDKNKTYYLVIKTEDEENKIPFTIDIVIQSLF